MHWLLIVRDLQICMCFVFVKKALRLALNAFHGRDPVLIPGGTEPVCACPSFYIPRDS
jgi:hypothetical protein